MLLDMIRTKNVVKKELKVKKKLLLDMIRRLNVVKKELKVKKTTAT